MSESLHNHVLAYDGSHSHSWVKPSVWNYIAEPTLSHLMTGEGLTLSMGSDDCMLHINDEVVATVQAVEEKISAAKTSLEVQLATKVSSLEKEILDLRALFNQVDPVCEIRSRVLTFNLVDAV